MMTPLRRVTDRGDQVKFTCLCPATTPNITGAPAGAEKGIQSTKAEDIRPHDTRYRGSYYSYKPISEVVEVSVCGCDGTPRLRVTMLQL